MKPQRRKEVLTLVIVFVGVLLISALAVYFVGNRNKPEYTQVEQPGAVEREPLSRATPVPTQPPAQTPAGDETFLDHLMGTDQGGANVRSESWTQSFGHIALRLLLAALLGAALAYRPRR